MAETGIPPLYDEERGLRELARQRLKRDTLTRGQVQLADGLAEHLQRHFSAEETETAGRALLIGAASVASLVGEGCHLAGDHRQHPRFRRRADGHRWPGVA